MAIEETPGPNGYPVPIESLRLNTQLGFLASPLKVADNVYFLGAGPSLNDPRLRAPTNVDAADTTNADQLRTGGGLGLNLDGTGVTVHVWDGPTHARNTHQEFGGRLTFGDVDPSPFEDHATHVSGTIGAAGVNPMARGMAPAVNMINFTFDNDVAEMTTAGPNVRLSNHSYAFPVGWGDFNFGFGLGEGDTWFGDRSLFALNAASNSMESQNFGKYSDESVSFDQILFNNPNFLSVWAASNDRIENFQNTRGDGRYVTFFETNNGLPGWTIPGWYLVDSDGPGFTVTRPAGDGGPNQLTQGFDTLPFTGQIAKNSLVVGAVNAVTVDPFTAANVTMSSFSSWGPTDDGRIKPDVVGNGVSLFSSFASSDTAYDTISGTSMASPNVTGTMALLLQHFRNVVGNANAAVLSATMKGIAIHTATDAGNSGPDYTYGWGVVDGARAATFITDARGANPTQNRLLENIFTGTEQTRTIMSDGVTPIKATIVWTDPAGAAQNAATVDDTTRALVNDLDLTITNSANTIFRPWTLNPASPGTNAVQNARNSLDNVEQVLIAAPAAGTYTVRVNATGTVNNQAYSLLISGDVDRPTVTIAATDASASETGPDTGTFTVTRSAVSAAPLTVNFTTAGSTATSGSDYVAIAGSAIIPANQTSTTVVVTPIDDLIVDNPASPTTPETVILNLSADPAYILGAAPTQTATVNIADNDSSIQFGSATFAVAEGSGGGFVNSNVVTLTRTGVTTAAQSAQVGVNAPPGTAIGGTTPASPTDYNNTGLPITVNFAASETSKTVNIPIFADTVVEGNETVNLRIVPGSAIGVGANIGAQTTTTLTITNDDVLPPLVPTPGTTTIPSGTGRLLLGNNLDNVIVGAASNDTIYGYAGNDVVDAAGGNDYVDGGIGNDLLFGGLGNDTVVGGAGFDTLSGVRRSADPGLGLGEQDRLIGGADADLFLLGDGIGVYYSDNNPATSGFGDFAIISDFSVGIDRIQLNGLSTNYAIGTATGGGFTGAGIFRDDDGIAGLSANDELIGILSGISPASLILNSSTFAYV